MTRSTFDVSAIYAQRRIAEFCYALFAIFGTAAGTVCAVVIAAVQGGLDPFYIWLCSVMLVATGFGVSLGLHRFFSHHSFTTNPSFRLALAILGIASGQGYLIRWVHDHRVHHRYADTSGDPHSPYWYGSRPLNAACGLLHAHFLWLLRRRPDVQARYVRDFSSDKHMVFIDRMSPLIVLVGILAPGSISLLVEPTVMGFAKGCLWGGFVRMFLMNHITWAVNSFGHRFGSRPNGATSFARNNVVLGVLAFGDGWHANHHLAPSAARHGLNRQQFDLNWLVLSALLKLRIVTSVRPPFHTHVNAEHYYSGLDTIRGYPRHTLRAKQIKASSLSSQ